MTVLAHRVDGARTPSAAPPLVLLNSIGTTTAMWDPVLDALTDRRDVIRLDTRGHGASGPAEPLPDGRPGRLADLGTDVLETLDALGLGRVDLAGLSVGGMTGMWLAAREPERIARLALLCTSAYLPPREGWIERAHTARREGMAAVGPASVGRWITPGLATSDPALADRLLAMIMTTDAEGYAQCCEAIGGMDLRPDLPRIIAPTLVIAGADDPATPPAHAEVIVNGIHGARVEIVAPAAHLATVERPGIIGALLREHFAPPDDTRTRGAATRRAVLGDAHVDRASTAVTPFTRDWQDFITEYAWGAVWTRPGLGRRERSIATLSALVSIGNEHELRLHVRGALRNGLTADEIAEILLHVAVYAGVPRANRAFAIAREVIEEEST